MTSRKYPVCLTLMLLSCLTGCARPMQRSLLEARLERFQVPAKRVQIASIEVSDERPKSEAEELTPDVSYVVPIFPLWIQWGTEGHLRPDAKYYSKNVTGDMKQLVQRAVRRSGMSSKAVNGAAKVHLKVKMKHLYGVTHHSHRTIIVAGVNAAGTSQRSQTFAPYGFAAAEVEVYDDRGALVGRQLATGKVDPNLLSLLKSAGEKGEGRLMTDRLTQAAVQAAGRLAGNIVKVAAAILYRYPTEVPIDIDSVSTFYITRHTPDGLFREVAGIDIATGNIVTSTIQRRWMEPYAAINEWVVDPYYGGESRLSPRQYARLLKRVRQRFDARFRDNVHAARFFGAKPGAF